MFDPEHPEKSLVLKGGRVVEVTDLDVEQGGDIEMTGLEEGAEETNNTVDNIEDRRSSKDADDEHDLETEKYRVEEEGEEEKKEDEKKEEEKKEEKKEEEDTV